MDSSSVMSLCRFLQFSWWATDIRESLWVYPFIQLIHFIGLSLWVGTNIVGDVRLLNLGNKPQTAREVRDELFVWNWVGFTIVVLGGFLLFSSRATIYILNPAFRVKLFMLVPIALIWHIFVQAKTPSWGGGNGNRGGRQDCGTDRDTPLDQRGNRCREHSELLVGSFLAPHSRDERQRF